MKWQENVLLAPYTYFKIGGKADYFCQPENKEGLISALKEAAKNEWPIFILGGGTNLLVSDSGFGGAVINLNNFCTGNNKKCFINGEKITAASGILMSELVNFAAENSLAGFEWTAGLPGTLGGAVRGNAGSFGREIKDVILEVKSIIKSPPYKILTRQNQECDFGYRNSIFKKNNEEIILETVLKLRSGNQTEIKSAMQKNVDYRLKNHPMEYPSAGSTFKNVRLEVIPENWKKYFSPFLKNDPFPLIPAGIIIKEAGLSGKIMGNAQVSLKHSNFIVNLGGAAAYDVKLLIDFIKKTVKEKFDIMLEEEIVYVGEF